jgi:hypothetical protein
MADLPAILTSNSAYGTFMTCPRKRYWAYEAPSDSTSETRGWERKSMSLPLSTGGWCHRVAQGLLIIAFRGVLGHLWAEVLGEGQDEARNALNRQRGASAGCSTADWIQACASGYQREAHERGLDLGLQMDGSLPEEKFVGRTIAEQSALLEAFGWDFLRIRIANIISEYHLLDVRQKPVLLSADVGWDSEYDALLERKSDGKRFGYRIEISGNPDRRWRQGREIDHTLLVDGVDGVLIDGFDMGERVKLDPETLRECREHVQPWEGQRNCLVYGYKHESYGRAEYSSKNITQKGWGKFAVWEEQFTTSDPHKLYDALTSPIAYWVNWLPIEQVEEMLTSFTVLRNDKAVESIRNQIIAVERNIRDTRDYIDLDEFFPQNLRACIYDKCQFFAMCHGNAASDPQKHGFIARREK